MDDRTVLWNKVSDLATKLRTNGQEIERSLQVATGAVVLSLLSALPTTWVDAPNLMVHLRSIYIGALTGVGIAFLLALSATLVRTVMFEVGENEETARKRVLLRVLLVMLFAWGFQIVLALTLIILTGVGLADQLDHFR